MSVVDGRPRSAVRLTYSGRSFAAGHGFVVGSAQDADLRIDRRGVAAQQLLVRAGADGWQAECTADSPVLVNGEPLSRGARRFLAAGDLISVGDRAIRVELEAPSTPQPATAPVMTGRFVIGRDPACDLVLDDQEVSRRHAELVTVDGERILNDLGSSNGVLIDGRPATRRPVRTGDVCRIGPFDIVITDDGAVRRSVAAPTVEAREIAVDVARGKRILHPLSVRIEPGEFIAVIGGSGAGKSTFVRALAGIRPPSTGTVLLDDRPTRGASGAIGYVPQDDIVHPELTVREALGYAAELRLASFSAAERATAVERVIREVELDEHAEKRIGRLSGGQRKRTSVAVELLGQPGVLVLDEPTTGLDPALDARMMALFGRLASGGRTVIVVTHATRTLHRCDRVLLMAPGGHLRYDGPPEQALERFGVQHYDELYPVVEATAAEDRPIVVPRATGSDVVNGHTAATTSRPSSALKQSWILLCRGWRLVGRDTRNLAILAGQVPVIAALVALLFDADVLRRPGGHPGDAAQVVFLLVTTAVWFGAIDSAREIVKERTILARERATGLSVSAYLFSKTLIVATLAIAQTVALLLLVLAVRPFDEPASTLLALGSVLAATAVVAVCMGLTISAITRSQDQATSMIPLALIPQLLFAGAVIPEVRMPEVASWLTEAVFANVAYAGAGTAMHLQQRLAEDAELARVEPYGTDFFALAVTPTVGRLALFAAVFLIVAYIVLRHRSD